MSSRKALIKIGCCGFRTSRSAYYPLLLTVEIQHTFYQPPQIQTLEKWRGEAPSDFEFTIKAWQLITHQASSPTYQRLKRVLTDDEKAGSGSFRSSLVVREAWDVTKDCAQALQSKTILFQCPASFRPTKENVGIMRKFFRRAYAEREVLNFCWEPRGAWPREMITDLCDELDLWHVVDPFKERTVTPARCYFRLHGRRGWRYQYEDGELEELASMLPEDAESYVFFNNIKMREDAVRFKAIIEVET